MAENAARSASFLLNVKGFALAAVQRQSAGRHRRAEIEKNPRNPFRIPGIWQTLDGEEISRF